MVALKRAERNNNFGNLNYIPPPHNFNGQTGLEDPPAGGGHARFGKYDTPFNGARAAYEEILTYVLRDGKNTVRLVVETWAPTDDPDGGNEDAPYEERVCNIINDTYELTEDSAGITPTTNIVNAVRDPVFLAALGGGIFTVESGHFPVNLDAATNLAAAKSALQAKGLA